MNDRCTYIFPHIPKCGGTTLHEQLDKSGLKVFFDYDHPPSVQKFLAQKCRQRNQDYALLDFGGFDIVYGHFPIERYNKDHYRRIALLRDPLERAISHFFYWKNDLAGGSLAMSLARTPFLRDIREGKMGFIEFVEELRLDSFYASYLGNKLPADFELVGFVDCYKDFADRLAILLGIEIDPTIMRRQSRKESIDRAVLDQAKGYLRGDFDIYAAYRDYWLRNSRFGRTQIR